jgi:elongation factor G
MTMKSVDLPHLRSVVLAGHAGAGKTTLAEQLLFRSGAIPRLGRVDDGTAHLDYEPEEQKRRQSLTLAVGTFEQDGTRISLLDTPGYPDFFADVIEGFAAVDAAILVMDASGGVEAGLEHAVRLARTSGKAACLYIN